MSGQDKSLMSYKAPISHHSKAISHDKNTQRNASNIRPSQWHSATNNKGNLVIAKKSGQTKSKTTAQIKVEKKIWNLISAFNEYARRSEKEEVTSEIMKIAEKYKRGVYDESGSNQTSRSESRAPNPTASNSMKIAEKPRHGVYDGNRSKQTSRPESRIPSAHVKITLHKENTVKMVAQTSKNNINQPSVEAKRNDRKVPNELLRLLNSDGFVVTPVRAKRTPKSIERFDDTLYASPQTRSVTRASTRALTTSSRLSSILTPNIKKEIARAPGRARKPFKKNFLNIQKNQ